MPQNNLEVFLATQSLSKLGMSFGYHREGKNIINVTNATSYFPILKECVAAGHITFSAYSLYYGPEEDHPLVMEQLTRAAVELSPYSYLLIIPDLIATACRYGSYFQPVN